MSYTKRDLTELASLVARDHRDAQAKLDDLRTMIASSDLPAEEGDRPACPECGHLGSVRTEQQLEEHMENVHGMVPRASA